jgi:hypothetical protein
MNALSTIAPSEFCSTFAPLGIDEFVARRTDLLYTCLGGYGTNTSQSVTNVLDVVEYEAAPPRASHMEENQRFVVDGNTGSLVVRNKPEIYCALTKRERTMLAVLTKHQLRAEVASNVLPASELLEQMNADLPSRLHVLQSDLLAVKCGLNSRARVSLYLPLLPLLQVVESRTDRWCVGSRIKVNQLDANDLP